MNNVEKDSIGGIVARTPGVEIQRSVAGAGPIYKFNDDPVPGADVKVGGFPGGSASVMANSTTIINHYGV
ncbi:hypothetical protein EBU24_06740, partial [bacterium]|nr:hypothetical protein [bacterium]